MIIIIPKEAKKSARDAAQSYIDSHKAVDCPRCSGRLAHCTACGGINMAAAQFAAEEAARDTLLAAGWSLPTAKEAAFEIAKRL